MIDKEIYSVDNNRYYSSEQVFNSLQKIKAYFHASNRGWRFPLTLHSHEFYEINIVTEGEGYHYINDVKQKIVPGDVFIIKPKMQHGYIETRELSVYHILLNKSFFDIYQQSLDAMPGSVSLFSIEPDLRNNNAKNTFLHLQVDQLDSIHKNINQLEDLIINLNIYSYNIQAAIVFQIICKLCMFFHSSAFISKTNKANSYTSQIIYSLEIMKENLSQKITIENIAEKLFLSKSTFIRQFTKITNTPPFEYLTNLRIEKAKKLLKETKHSLTFIASECGFFDLSHFEKQFLKHCNTLPKQYRRQNEE